METGMMAEIVALNLGQPKPVVYHGRSTTTAGDKLPVAEAWLGREGFTGDAQADRDNHGGPEKAVCAYPYDHYPYWAAVLGRALPSGAFSENLTLAGLDERQACLGDVYRAGEALVQVCQPRIPCFKLAGRLDHKAAPDLIHANGFSGYYLRVLEPGRVRAGDPLSRVSADPARVSIQHVNEVLYGQREDEERVQAVLGVEAISRVLRRMMMRRLAPR
jgi:MOSC domain-containing protein YiiM